MQQNMLRNNQTFIGSIVTMYLVTKGVSKQG